MNTFIKINVFKSHNATFDLHPNFLSLIHCLQKNLMFHTTKTKKHLINKIQMLEIRLRKHRNFQNIRRKILNMETYFR